MANRPCGACGIRTRGLCNADAALWPAELTPRLKNPLCLTTWAGITMKTHTKVKMGWTGDGTRTRDLRNDRIQRTNQLCYTGHLLL